MERGKCGEKEGKEERRDTVCKIGTVYHGEGLWKG
jgi:hypothetical protein